MSEQTNLLGTPDKEKVKALFDALAECTNIFLEKNHLTHVDVFMASHNYHKQTVLAIELQTGNCAGVWRVAAITTLTESLTVAPPMSPPPPDYAKGDM